MITLEQAKSLRRGDILHDDRDRKGADGRCLDWKVTGQVQTWVTQPERVRVPVKWGMRGYSQFTSSDLAYLHLESDCPNLFIYFKTQEPGVYNIDIFAATGHKIGDGRLVNLEALTERTPSANSESNIGWSWTVSLYDPAGTTLTEGKLARFRSAKFRIKAEIRLAPTNPKFAAAIKRAKEEVRKQ